MPVGHPSCMGDHSSVRPGVLETTMLHGCSALERELCKNEVNRLKEQCREQEGAEWCKGNLIK